jgi:hypothetical protein
MSVRLIIKHNFSECLSTLSTPLHWKGKKWKHAGREKFSLKEQGPKFKHRPIYVGFVVDMLAVRQVFF